MNLQEITSLSCVVCAIPALFKNVYTLVLMIAAARPPISSSKKKPSLRRADHLSPLFQFLIPAHNESTVIGSCVASIFAMNYSKERIKVAVIADNCSDETGDVAEGVGATVFRRFTSEISGKAKALEYGLDQLHAQAAEFHYLVVVDADNILAESWATVVSSMIADYPDGFQTSVETKNPDDDAVTFGNYLSFVIMNRVVQEGRSHLGLPAMLAGTGMGFSREFLASGKFQSQSLTEDRDLSLRALVNRYNFRWIGSAEIFDEKPLGVKASFKQYKRWSSGLLSDAPKLGSALGLVLSQGRVLTAIDIIFANLGSWLASSYVLLALHVLIGILLGTWFPAWFFAGIVLASIVLLALIVWLHGHGWPDVKRLWTYIYVRMIGWASLASALFRPDTKWSKTEHGRPMVNTPSRLDKQKPDPPFKDGD